MSWRACGFMVGVVVLMLQACSASIDVDKSKLKSRPVGCVKGSALACPCAGGGTSQQLCNEFGRYNPCQCSSANFGAGTGG